MVNGLPPAFRGTTYSSHDLDVQVAKLFPEAAQFIEKPISQGPVEEVEKVEEALRSGGLTSIGYMLRYLQGEKATLLQCLLRADMRSRHRDEEDHRGERPHCNVDTGDLSHGIVSH